MNHAFTNKIIEILKIYFGVQAEEFLQKNELLKYLNLKTKSAERGSKSRSSFGNLYAIYVLVEDYYKKGFYRNNKYKDYEGAVFSELFARQRELPFGSKLQNHALNHRMNQEFKKFFPTCDYIPIIRLPETKRYWINEELLIIRIGRKKYNIAATIIEIIDCYIQSKTKAFNDFVDTCKKLKKYSKSKDADISNFIFDLLRPNVDARIFEIVSYSILKYYYNEQVIFWGYDLDKLEEEQLTLYKTGRTNANDGGIDFVMKPLGRFFQVTENLDVKKYFLDIDKIERYPITFVIKTSIDIDKINDSIKKKAIRQYSIKAVVNKYMNCIEEIINIPVLEEYLNHVINQGKLHKVIQEIIIQSKVEFNFE